jgi:hypothetical protein
VIRPFQELLVAWSSCVLFVGFVFILVPDISAKGLKVLHPDWQEIN